MLEASRAATKYGMYERHGFRTIDLHTYADKDRFPNGSPVTLVTMIRDSKGA